MGKKELRKYQIYLPPDEADVLDRAIKDSSLTASSYIRSTVVSNLRRRGYFGKPADSPELGNHPLS